MRTFEWQPRIDAQSETDYKARILQFGDGYEQRQDGQMHTDLRVYPSLEFVGEKSEIEEIERFLNEHKGVKSFMWQAPDRNQPRKYVTDGKIAKVFVTGWIWKLTCTFKEVII